MVHSFGGWWEVDHDPYPNDSRFEQGRVCRGNRANGLAMHTVQRNGDLRPRMEVRMKYSMPAIPVEVLGLAFLEFVFVSTYAAVLWYMFSGR